MANVVKYLVVLYFAVSAPLCAQAQTPLTGVQIQSLTQLDQARLAFEQGSYESALNLAQASETAESLALQAEIMSTQIMLDEIERPHSYAGQARALAQKALELNPESVEAKIQYAVALGFEARTAGIFKAWRQKLPEKSRGVIIEASIAAPDDARTHALLGAWHLGIVEKAGEARAERMYGASLEEGQQAYKRALELAPNDIIIRSNYALALLAIDAQAHEFYARGLTERLLRAPVRTATERHMQENMQEILPLFTEPKALRHRLAELMQTD